MEIASGKNLFSRIFLDYWLYFEAYSDFVLCIETLYQMIMHV